MKTKNTLSLVTFEQAKRLKKAGFDWPVDRFFVDIEDVPNERKTAFPFWSATPPAYPKCPTNWNALKVGGKKGNISAPTVALALKWMRDVKGIDWQIVWVEIEGVAYAGEIKPLGAEGMVTRVCLESTCESAESALLDELLTLIEK